MLNDIDLIYIPIILIFFNDVGVHVPLWLSKQKWC